MPNALYLLNSDGTPVDKTNPLWTQSSGGGGGAVTQGAGSGDATKYWVQRQSNGTDFILPAKDSTLTDGSLRVGGSVAVTGTFWQTTQPVSGPLTDTQLRASAVLTSVASLPLPSGAAKDSTLTDGSAKTIALLNDGTQQVGTTAKPVQVQIGDGTTQATVKAASTAAVTGDKASVVALSPNAPALTTAKTSKGTSASSVTLLAANSARKSASFYNMETTADLYLDETGGTATTALGGSTVCLKRDSGNGGGYYELPVGANGGVTQGTITGIWTTTGSLGVNATERT